MPASAKVFDVAAFILERTGAIQPMKLEKLTYYSQAWALMRDGGPIFNEHFEGWRNGPVCPELYRLHQGKEQIHVLSLGDPGALGERSQMTVNAVLSVYGAWTSQALSDLTHREGPWRLARVGLSSEEPGNVIITLDSMREYYGAVDTPERRHITAFGTKINPLVQYMQDMDDDEAALIDELSKLDDDIEVAKLSVQ